MVSDTSGILFKSNEIEDAEKSFDELKYTPFQRKIIIDMANLLTNFIPMTPIAMRGFISFALKDWQKFSKKHTEAIHTMTPEERIESMAKIIEFLTARVIKVLKNSEDEQKIHEAMKKGFEYYKKTYAHR